MIVFKNNYKNFLPLFKESLDNCDFLSFDCEMTGVTCDLKTDATKYDTQQFRYYKNREIVKKYELIQIGITFYMRTEKNQEGIIKEDENKIEKGVLLNSKFYKERTFTFYLFKNSRLRFLSDIYTNKHEFSIFSNYTTCHPATLKFLKDNNFDLNIMVENGIHFNKLAHHGKIKDAVAYHLKEGKMPNSIVYLSKTNEAKLLEVIKTIAKFLLFGKESEEKEDENPKKKNKYQKNEKNLKINNLNTFLINYLLSMNLKQLFKVSQMCLSRDKTDSTGSTLIVEKSRANLNMEEFLKCYGSYESFCNSLSMDLILKAKYTQFKFEEKDFESVVDEELGFTKFIQLIVDKNSSQPVPIVGHNILFDLLFIYDKFIEDLPDNFYEFKNSINKCFPIIIDNKFLTMRLAKEFDNTKLEFLYKDLKKNKFDIFVDIKPDVVNGFTLYKDIDSSTSFHDAGYDSVITGRCFVYLLKALENNFQVENKKGTSHQIGNDELKNVKAVELKLGFVDFSMRNDLLEEFTNRTKLSMIEEPFDVCNFLTNKESSPDFVKQEEALISSIYKYIYVVILKHDQKIFNTIYDVARLFENNLFNLSVVKIDDHVAFIEFIPIEQNYQSEEEKLKLLNEVVENSKTQNESLIDNVLHYSSFTNNFHEIIKF